MKRKPMAHRDRRDSPWDALWFSLTIFLTMTVLYLASPHL